MVTSMSKDGEAQMQNIDHKRGGWVTFPFIIATMAGLTLAGGGWQNNLIVYLIQEFNVKNIDAVQISNIVNGCICLFPIVGAIIADSYLGCYMVILASSVISLLGILCLLLTASINSLRPQPCENGPNLCIPPTKFQDAVLYTSLGLAAFGFGGSRFTMGTMGANQFSNPNDQETYFNWYFFTMYLAAIISCIPIVYVEDNISWALGFGLCIAANLLGLATFLIGTRHYRHVRPQRSVFTSLAQVIIATIRKWKLLPSTKTEDYYYGINGMPIVATLPSRSLRFLNRGALKIEGDVGPGGQIARPWNLCTVQQVEDLKTLFKILPLWSSSIFLGTPIGILSSLSLLQALTMDRHLGPHFKISVGFMIVFVLLSSVISLSLFDRFLWPTWKRLVGQSSTPLQRIGIGHVLNIASMVVAPLVEVKRRKTVQSDHSQGHDMSVLWLVPQLAIMGVGEAFHFPAQVALYYQEFPTSLKNLATAMAALLIGIAFYLSTALIHFVQMITKWLPNDINEGKIDYVYWVLVVVGVLNFGYYLLCAWLYKYRNYEPMSKDIHSEESSL